MKVLNLCENKIDVQGLVAIAEALVRRNSRRREALTYMYGTQKYNLTLETLDLSRNPCSGPYLEGVCVLYQAVEIDWPIELRADSISSDGVHLEHVAKATLPFFNHHDVSGRDCIGRVSSRVGVLASS